MAVISGVWHRDARTPDCFGALPAAGAQGTRVIFDGRLDNRDDLLRLVSERGEARRDCSDVELVALSYAVSGESFITHLLGDFALALFDERRQRLVLARDAIGTRPLYFAALPGRLVFASRIQRILEDPDVRARPNDRLLAGLVLEQLHRQDDDGATFFDGVSSVPASHVAIVDADRVHVRRYWDFAAGARADAMSFEEGAAALHRHLAAAVDRRLRGSRPVAISVSGGLDSSALFALAKRGAHARNVYGFTYTADDGSPADETAFVADLEREYGRIERVAVPGVGSVLDGARDRIRRVEAPVLDLQGNRSAAFMTAIARRGAQTVMTGHWGDQLMFDQAYLVDSMKRLHWATVRAHLDEYRRWFPDAQGDEFSRRLVSDVLDHAAPGWVRPVARRVRSAWRPPSWWRAWYTPRFRGAAGEEGFPRDVSAGARATALERALYREARSKYHALCLENNSKESAHYGLSMAFPFLDRDLVSFVIGVPGQLLARAGVPKALLREAVCGIVPETIRARRTKGDFSAVVNEAAARDLSEMTHLLSGEPLVVQFGYAEVDKLKAGLSRAEHEMTREGFCVPAWRIADLVALELWLQEFFGRT